MSRSLFERSEPVEDVEPRTRFTIAQRKLDYIESKKHKMGTLPHKLDMAKYKPLYFALYACIFHVLSSIERFKAHRRAIRMKMPTKNTSPLHLRSAGQAYV